MNHHPLFAIFFLVLSLGLTNVPAARADLVEGKDYTVLTNPQPTQDPKTIEVLEFFWYGCPHCNTLHPHLKAWTANIPADVSFRYVPATLRANWVAAAKLFYAIETLDLIDTLHDKIYDAVHRDKFDLNNESVLFDWIEKQGIDRKKFENTYNSFSVQNQIARTTQMVRHFQLTGVPALIVNGKYLVTGKAGGTPQDTIKTLELLIEKIRKTQ